MKLGVVTAVTDHFSEKKIYPEKEIEIKCGKSNESMMMHDNSMIELREDSGPFSDKINEQKKKFTVVQKVP